MIVGRSLLALWLGICVSIGASSLRAAEETKAPIEYGDNAAAGHTLQVNGIPLYYEIYGEGEPLLIIHPNGGDIASMGHQIEFFSKKYKVIAADSRGFGKSPIGAGKLTYEKMTSDLEGLLDHLEIKSETILGWSDGGIIGLMMAINHPERVERLAIMGANVNPEGANDWAVAWIGKQMEKVDKMIAADPSNPDYKDMRQQLDLMLTQPHIPYEDLAKIGAPVLVMAGDKDIIKTEHTVKIFDSLTHAQLCIFPGATHQIPYRDPERFNRAVDEFLSKPFTRPDSRNGMK